MKSITPTLWSTKYHYCPATRIALSFKQSRSWFTIKTNNPYFSFIRSLLLPPSSFKRRGSIRGLVANVLYYDIVESDFTLLLSDQYFFEMFALPHLPAMDWILSMQFFNKDRFELKLPTKNDMTLNERNERNLQKTYTLISLLCVPFGLFF